MLTQDQQIYAVLVPIVLTIVAALSGMFPRRGTTSERGGGDDAGAGKGGSLDAGRSWSDRSHWRLPILFGLSVLIAFWGTSGWIEEKWQYVMLLPVVGAVVGVLMGFAGGVVSTILLAVVLGAGVTGVLWPIYVPADPWLARLIPGLATVLLLLLLEPLARRRPGASVPLGMWLVTATSAGLILESGDMSIGVPFGAIAIVMFFYGLFLLGMREWSIGGGALAVVVPLVASLPVVRYLYMSVEGVDRPVIAFVLPAVGALVLWVGELPFLARRSAWVRLPVRLGLVGAVCGLALLLALGAGAGADDEQTTDDPYADMYGV